VFRNVGTLCTFHLHRWFKNVFLLTSPMKMEHTECSETSEHAVCSIFIDGLRTSSCLHHIWRWDIQIVPKRRNTLFHLHIWFKNVFLLTSPMKMGHTECSKTSEHCLFHLHRWDIQSVPKRPNTVCSIFIDGLRTSSCLHHLWWWDIQSVPKCRNIKFRRRGITRKK